MRELQIVVLIGVVSVLVSLCGPDRLAQAELEDELDRQWMETMLHIGEQQ